MTEKRETYCRACGTNKGHNSAGCKNAAGLRAVIKCQDDEIAGLMDRASSSNVNEQAARRLEQQCAYLERIISALLDLAESKRRA
jgi:hypothetical protein